MIITLDWDQITGMEAFRRCKRILKNIDWVRSIDLFESPTKNGFHAYLYCNDKLMLDTILWHCRYLLHDDPKRLDNDKRFRNYEQSILFTEKVIEGKRHRDQFLRTFTR